MILPFPERSRPLLAVVEQSPAGRHFAEGEITGSEAVRITGGYEGWRVWCFDLVWAKDLTCTGASRVSALVRQLIEQGGLPEPFASRPREITRAMFAASVADLNKGD